MRDVTLPAVESLSVCYFTALPQFPDAAKGNKLFPVELAGGAT